MAMSSLAPVTFDRISVDPDRMGGVPCVRDLRFPVASVVAMVADGMTAAEITTEHPDLEAGAVVVFDNDRIRVRSLPMQP